MRLSAGLDNIRRVSAARALGVEGMNNAPLESRERILDQARFIYGVGVERELERVLGVRVEPEMLEDFADAVLVEDRGEKSASAAAGAEEDVDQVVAAHQVSPGVALAWHV